MVSNFVVENNRRVYDCFQCNKRINKHQKLCIFNPCSCLIHESCKKKTFTYKYFASCPNCSVVCEGLQTGKLKD